MIQSEKGWSTPVGTTPLKGKENGTGPTQLSKLEGGFWEGSIVLPSAFHKGKLLLGKIYHLTNRLCTNDN